MNFHILTLFPEMIMHGLSESIIGRASKAGFLSIEAVNIRDYAANKHKKADDYPYGGGAGMLMQAQPVYDAWKSVVKKIGNGTMPVSEEEKSSFLQYHKEGRRARTVYLTPQGTTFTQNMAEEFAKEEDLILLCGHYEGIDERVLEEIVTDYVSIGDYVLTGGELAAMVIVDAVARLVPGVLNNEVSAETESFHNHLLEYPQYSRPVEWHGKKVPAVLMSGNQKNIRAWRLEEAEKRTKERRPDLYKKYQELQECRKILLKKKLLHIDMIELISRGQAELIFAQGNNICLKDKQTGIYFHTAENKETGYRMLETIKKDFDVGRENIIADFKKEGMKKNSILVWHQDFMSDSVKEFLGTEDVQAYRHAVYTKKEKLPMTGLYRQIENNAIHLEIRKLGMEHVDSIKKNFWAGGFGEDVISCIKKGRMFGAFADETLAGMIGVHPTGNIGMLEVVPGYRGRNIGKALETHVINDLLESGQIPYGKVEFGNTAAERMQESLGLYFSKELVYQAC